MYHIVIVFFLDLFHQIKIEKLEDKLFDYDRSFHGLSEWRLQNDYPYMFVVQNCKSIHVISSYGHA